MSKCLLLRSAYSHCWPSADARARRGERHVCSSETGRLPSGGDRAPLRRERDSVSVHRVLSINDKEREGYGLREQL